MAVKTKIALCYLLLAPFVLLAQGSNYDFLYQNTVAARYVNPFIGTAGEGATHPHATSPWGMVSAGPHTTYTTKLGYVFGQKIAPAGYYYGEPVIDGFGQTHLSGVACPELGAPVLAVNYEKLRPGDYASHYSDEVAKAGYYAVSLDDARTRVEITTTQRAAYYRLTFLGNGKFYVLLDAYKNLSWIKHQGFIKKIDDQTYCGWSMTGNFCNQRNKQKVWFYLKAKTVPQESGLWSGHRGVKNATQLQGRVGAWLAYDNVRSVDIIIGISYVSAENAKLNLEKEIGNKDFGTVLRENIEAWDRVLGRIKIADTGREREKQIFYTALYHVLLHPNVVSDVNGDYPLYEAQGHGNSQNYIRYGLFSMWDTYRNVHALLNLLYPDQAQDMLYTLEAMTLEAGHAPRWELYGSEVNLMVGDPALSILSEGYVKGFKFHHPDSLFSVLYWEATDTVGNWRPGNNWYWNKGFIPEKTRGVWGSVSTTLEYCYHDWALGQFAHKLGRDRDAEKLIKQARTWRTFFDKQTMVLRPKDKHDKFISPFDPAAMNSSWFVSLFVKNHGGPGFVEGNAYQYTYMVPHDIHGLINLFGSVKEFSRNLVNIFENGYFTLWNEPDMLYPYLLGIDKQQIDYMQKQLQFLRTEYFKTDPDGIPGNDDAGTLSCWYVFSALGFYPVNPASGEYFLGVPLFQDIQIELPQTDAILRIRADFDVDRQRWTSVKFNNQTLDTILISHKQLVNGGELFFSSKE